MALRTGEWMRGGFFFRCSRFCRPKNQRGKWNFGGKREKSLMGFSYIVIINQFVMGAGERSGGQGSVGVSPRGGGQPLWIIADSLKSIKVIRFICGLGDRQINSGNRTMSWKDWPRFSEARRMLPGNAKRFSEITPPKAAPSPLLPDPFLKLKSFRSSRPPTSQHTTSCPGKARLRETFPPKTPGFHAELSERAVRNSWPVMFQWKFREFPRPRSPGIHVSDPRNQFPEFISSNYVIIVVTAN